MITKSPNLLRTFLGSISKRDWLAGLAIWLIVNFFCVSLFVYSMDGNLISSIKFALISPLFVPFLFLSDIVGWMKEMPYTIIIHPIIDIPLFAFLSSRFRKKQ